MSLFEVPLETSHHKHRLFFAEGMFCSVVLQAEADHWSIRLANQFTMSPYHCPLIKIIRTDSMGRKQKKNKLVTLSMLCEVEFFY